MTFFLQPIRINCPTPHSFLIHLILFIHSSHLEYHLFVHFILAMYYPSFCLAWSLKSSFKHFNPEWFYNSEFHWSIFFFTYSAIYCVITFDRMGDFIHQNFRRAALFMMSNQSKEIRPIPGNSVQCGGAWAVMWGAEDGRQRAKSGWGKYGSKGS